MEVGDYYPLYHGLFHLLKSLKLVDPSLEIIHGELKKLSEMGAHLSISQADLMHQELALYSWILSPMSLSRPTSGATQLAIMDCHLHLGFHRCFLAEPSWQFQAGCNTGGGYSMSFVPAVPGLTGGTGCQHISRSQQGRIQQHAVGVVRNHG